MDDDCYSSHYLQDVLAGWPLELGGKSLLDDAHHETGQCVETCYPWEGDGAKPGERISAYVALL